MAPADLRDDLVALSRAIHADPELSYQEHRAVERIATLVERHGHRVEKPLGGLATAFRARLGPPGPAVALLAEYDALPDVGHGCGHNLIALSNVGAFLIAAAQPGALEVGIALVGTPAEEHGAGKIELLRAGVFADTVAVLSSHPGSDGWSIGRPTLGVRRLRVTFHGLAAHAAASPERGRSALSGVIQLFVGVDAWRLRLPRDARVHGIVTKGGVVTNIVPALAEALFELRAADAATLTAMLETFTEVARGAALQTSTTVELAQDEPEIAPTRTHPALTDLLARELRGRGVVARTGELVSASTDLGNVSQVVPTDAVSFPVSETRIAGHSHAMREASVSDLAHESALVTAEVLGAAARRVATDAALRRALEPGAG